MLRTLLFAAAAAFFSTSAYAAVSATQRVEQEIVVKDETGKPTIKRVAADAVAPGEEVIYTLAFKNDGDEPADAMVLVMPVPAEISYVEGSVTGAGAKVAFSADGGQTYVGRGRLTVVENGVARPARGDEITHIKWTLGAPLNAGATGEVSYRGLLR